MVFAGIMIALTVISVFVFGILYTLFTLKQERYPGDNPIVYNFMTKYIPTAVGIQMKRFSGPDREAILIRKYDRNYMELYKKKMKDKSEDYLVFFNENQLTTFPKGSLSPDRDIVILLPPSPEDLTEEFKSKKIGSAISQIIEGKNYDRKLNELIREYSDRKDAILKNWSGGEMTSDLLSHMNLLFNDYTKAIIKTNKEKPPYGENMNYRRFNQPGEV